MLDYSKVERKVFDLINEVRQNPQLLVEDLKAMIKNFNKRYYKVPNTNINIITNEGSSAVEEAIEFLQQQDSIEPLIHSEGLYLAAQDHCQDIGKRGVASHESEDGSRMCDRVEKYGEWMISIAENICFDDSDPKEIVMGQLIDDGNQSRGHRLNIFNPEFKFVGVACGPHKVFKNCSVFNFAVSFKDENKKEKNAFQNEQTEQDNVYRRRTTIPEDNTIVNKRGSFGQPNFNANQNVTVEGGQDDNIDDGVLKEDMEMPEGAVDCKIKRIIKRVGNKKITKTIRTYIMENGEKEVEEEIDEEFVKDQQQILQNQISNIIYLLYIFTIQMIILQMLIILIKKLNQFFMFRQHFIINQILSLKFI